MQGAFNHQQHSRVSDEIIEGCESPKDLESSPSRFERGTAVIDGVIQALGGEQATTEPELRTRRARACFSFCAGFAIGSIVLFSVAGPATSNKRDVMPLAGITPVVAKPSPGPTLPAVVPNATKPAPQPQVEEPQADDSGTTPAATQPSQPQQTTAPTPAPSAPAPGAEGSASSAPQPLTAIGASLSSTMSTDSFPGHDFSATMCMDGVTGNTDGLWNFCMTPAPGWSALQEPWLSLRLEASATVGHVVIHGREDCCQRHLSPFEVWVGDKEGATEGAARCGGDGPEGVTSFDTSEWNTDEQKAIMVGPFTVECGGLKGEYVTLRLPGEGRLLTISEMTVYGAA
mmetsp:Transcript_38023/g.94876  ORF Transcript_38023/g.94876 Transcript_38023/m.94876 type:complete len:344 (-) Transcript_38023:246-1277(-)